MTTSDQIATEPRPRVQSAARAIEILMAVAQSEAGLTTREISERVGIGRQATYHLLHTLSGTGVLRRHGNRYVLGLRVGTIAESFTRQLAPAEHLAPVVRQIARATGETAYAAGWWSGDVAVLAVARGSNPVQAQEVPRGLAGHAHARASAKVLLAYAHEATRDAYLDGHEYVRLTPNTITSRSELDAQLQCVRNQGYGTDIEEYARGLCCLAVPVDEGFAPFAYTLSIPRDRFDANFDHYLAVMREFATTSGDVSSAGGAVPA